MSLGENKIKQILKKEHIAYEQEKVFEDLRNGKYRFDFYLPGRDIVIEFNGAQHYEFNDYFYANRSEYLKAKERDRRKIAYCLAQGIRIYCIPYWDLDQLTDFQSLTKEEYRARSKFHNDYIKRP